MKQTNNELLAERPKTVANEPPQMEVTFEEITPEIARIYLEKNFKKNRKLRPRRVQYMAAEIGRGEWIVNGATICFNVEGFLIDGQHRLAACIAAGKPIGSLVVRNAPMKSFYTIDTGSTRSAADILHIVGELNTMTLACATRYVNSWERHKNVGTVWREKASAMMIETMLRKHPKVRDAVSYVNYRYGRSALIPKIGASLYAAFFYIFSQRSEKEAQAFFDSLLTGEDLSRGHPILALRNQLLSNAQSGARFDPTHIGRLFVKAWNLFCKGERVSNSNALVAHKDEALDFVESPPGNKGHKARYGIPGP